MKRAIDALLVWAQSCGRHFQKEIHDAWHSSRVKRGLDALVKYAFSHPYHFLLVYGMVSFAVWYVMYRWTSHPWWCLGVILALISIGVSRVLFTSNPGFLDTAEVWKLTFIGWLLFVRDLIRDGLYERRLRRIVERELRRQIELDEERLRRREGWRPRKRWSPFHVLGFWCVKC